MGERVFISSTCYDLIDIRHEVEIHLRDLGLAPVLSDRPTSEFEIDPYKDSIATCLVNVRTADHFVCILSQRYGPKLGSAGFPDVSATHLEYREARSAGLPIIMLVRDRLVGDYDTWKRNGRSMTVHLPWVPTAKDMGLLEMLDEHAKLAAGSTTTNWMTPFTSIVDLKETLAKQLHARSLRAATRRLIDWADAPWVVPTQASNGSNCLSFQNVGRTPALNAEVSLVGVEDWHSLGHITAATQPRHNIDLSKAGNKRLLLRFDTVNGYRVEDRFDSRLDRNSSLHLAFAERVALRIP